MSLRLPSNINTTAPPAPPVNELPALAVPCETDVFGLAPYLTPTVSTTTDYGALGLAGGGGGDRRRGGGGEAGGVLLSEIAAQAVKTVESQKQNYYSPVVGRVDPLPREAWKRTKSSFEILAEAKKICTEVRDIYMNNIFIFVAYSMY